MGGLGGQSAGCREVPLRSGARARTHTQMGARPAKRDTARYPCRMNPITLGVLLALAAAASFGITTPLIQRFGEGLGPFTIAALLYWGASVGRTANEAPVARVHLGRLALVALFGAFIAPVFAHWVAISFSTVQHPTESGASPAGNTLHRGFPTAKKAAFCW